MWSSLRKQAAQIQSLTHDRLQQVTALAKEVLTDEGQDTDEQIEDDLIQALTPHPPLQPSYTFPAPLHSPVSSPLVPRPSPPLHPASHPNGRGPPHPQQFSYPSSDSGYSHHALPVHEDSEMKEVEIVDPSPAASHGLRVTGQTPLFSPASTSPSSVPPHSLRDSSPTGFFSSLPLQSPSSSSPSSSSREEERRLRAELEAREGELAAYSTELATARQQRRAMEDRHEAAVLEYQRVVRQLQDDVERLQQRTPLPLTSPRASPAHSPLSQSLPTPTHALPAAPPALQRSASHHEHVDPGPLLTAATHEATAAYTHHQHELAALQLRLEAAEAARQEEVAALEEAIAQLQQARDVDAREHNAAVRRLEAAHEEELLSGQRQLQAVKQQLREATERAHELETRVQAGERPSLPSAPHSRDDDDETEQRLTRVRAEYEGEIESLRRELMVASAKLSQATAASAVSPAPGPAVAAVVSPRSAVDAAQSESASLVASLRESNAKLGAELKAALAVKERMVAWKAEVQAVMAKWKKEREEREQRVKDLKRQVKALQKTTDDLSASRQQEGALWQEAESRARTEAEARLHEGEAAMEAERERLQQRLREVETEARRAWEEQAREREAFEAAVKRDAEAREQGVSRLREELMEAKRDRELAERDCVGLERELTALRQERDTILQAVQPDDGTEPAREHGHDFDAERSSLLQRLEAQSAAAQEARREVERLTVALSDLQDQAHLRAEEAAQLRTELLDRAAQAQALSKQVESLTAQLAAARQQSPPTAPTAIPSDGKVKELQGLLKQARDGYEALSRRFTEVQSECRSLMKKEEATNGVIAALTAEVQRLKSAGNDDVNAQLSESALQERLQQLAFDMQRKAAECDDWERRYKALQAEYQMAAAAAAKQAEGQERAHGGVDDRDEEVRSLRHQLQQLTLDAAAMESLAQDLSSLQRQSAQWAKEKATMQREVERLMAMLSQESDSRDREQQQREREAAQLRAKVEAASQAQEQAEHLSKELSLLNANLTAVRGELVAAQRQVRALTEEKAALRKGLDETLQRLQRFGADDDGQSIDRRLVVKMLVTFFEKGQRQEVLDLLYRILAFSPDDRRRVDASRGVAGANGLGGRLLGLASLLSPFDAEKARPPAAVEDGSLADMWVDFLLKESSKGEEGGGKKGGTGRIYEAMGSPAAAQSTAASANSFVTPQPTHRYAPPAGPSPAAAVQAGAPAPVVFLHPAAAGE